MKSPQLGADGECDAPGCHISNWISWERMTASTRRPWGGMWILPDSMLIAHSGI